MNERIVFTGCGVISPAGETIEDICSNAINKISFIRPLTKVNGSRLKLNIGGEIDIEQFQDRHKDIIPPREIRKWADFCKLAVYASHHAIKDASIDLDTIDKYRVGIIVGNSIGGMEYAEEQLKTLSLSSVEEIAPYLGTAWFPTAPQGQISILKKIHGYSKTYVCDRVSSAWAVHDSMIQLKKNNLDHVLCGGSEALISPLGLLILSSREEILNSNNCFENQFAPFTERRGGLVIGEGSVFFVMSLDDKALKEKSKIYGELAACVHNNDKVENPLLIDGEYVKFKKCIVQSLDEAGLTIDDIDCIIPSAIGTINCDLKEYNALKDIFKEKLSSIPISIPKTMFGDMLGASSVFDILYALLSITYNVIFPSVNINKIDNSFKLNIIRDTVQNIKLNNILILSRGLGGSNSAIIIKRYGS